MAKRIKDNDSVSNWFDYNLDIDSRIIYMGSVYNNSEGESGVDSFMAEYFIKAMQLMEAKESEKPVTVIMNNPGGDWYHGMAIYDAIKHSSCFCTIKVFGHAMSMGSLILQAADHRIMMPNSRFMIHYGYNSVNNHSRIYEKWSEENKVLLYDMENIYLDQMMRKEEEEGIGYLARIVSSVMTRLKSKEYPYPGNSTYKFSRSPKVKREELREVLREMLNFDTILTARETVDLGLADEVFSRV